MASARLRLLPCALALALTTVPCLAPAQSTPLSRGQLLQQIPPPMTTPTARTPNVTLPSSDTDTAGDTIPFAVRHIVVDGNTAIPTATSRALLADREGRMLTLTQVQVLARRLTEACHAPGYPLARTIVPAQTLHDGTVRLTVIEARYGKVELDNSSGVRDGLPQDALQPLRRGELVEQAA